MTNRLVIEPEHGWFSLRLSAIWQYRELLYFLIWRDVKVRYTQTALGVSWVILQPVLSTVVFTFLFGRLLKVPTGDVPYPLFVYAALLPWNYFASSLNRAAASVVNNASLVTKVYFPRLIIPLAGILSGLVDFCMASIVLAGLMSYYHVNLSLRIFMLFPFLLVAMITALGFGLWLSALNVRFRDVNLLTPFLLQIWMYATPVIYGSSIVPEKLRFLLGLNPMTGVVEGYRWALFGTSFPAGLTNLYGLIVPSGISLIVLASGAVFFRRSERKFADII